VIPLPTASPTDRIKLADWLELRALSAPDGGSSSGDLETVLNRAGILDGNGRDAIQQKVLEVFDELEDRAKAGQSGYPFKVNVPSLQLTEDWREHPAYVFCLCLSYFDFKQKKGSKDQPRRWFEHLSRDAVKHYLGGDALRFGSPRHEIEIPKSFREAIEFICKQLNEGKGYKPGGLPDRKDDALDIIAWKHFPDGLPGKLILFGNCASEKDWENSKKTELCPGPFCSDWMIEQISCQIVKTLFIPHRIERHRLVPLLRRAGIIFDRCRIAHWAYFAGSCSSQAKLGNKIMTYEPLAKWSDALIKKVAA
jgi:hypothetical protein